MKSSRIDIGSIRREQIVDAAIAIINEQGLQNLSLSEIEKKAEMSRGQLTYYFPTKEDILLAVFDRLVVLIHQRVGRPPDINGEAESGWSWVQHLLEKLLTQPPVSPEFGSLQYTFLSQMSHREDFRQRLAALYGQWRSNMGQGLAADLAKDPSQRQVSPRALATLVQALLHGLSMQRAVDPNAFDANEMCELCLQMISSYLWKEPQARRRRKTVANGVSRVAAGGTAGQPSDNQ